MEKLEGLIARRSALGQEVRATSVIASGDWHGADGVTHRRGGGEAKTPCTTGLIHTWSSASR